jgi:hypothetical protein
VFGSRRRREAAAAEAAREAERRALFAQLAQRPSNICPFLGLAYERTGYVEGPSIEHRCFAFGDPAPLSSEQQTRVCQERGYGQCPRYLRGLLVTPSDDLEVLRNPKAAVAAAQPAAAAAAPSDTRRRRRRVPIVAALVLLAVLGTAAVVAVALLSGALDLDGAGVAASASPSPTASPSASPTPQPPPSAADTAEPSATETALAFTPEPTPAAGDEFVFYEIFVDEGTYVVFEVADDGDVTDQATASFDEPSFAQVEPIEDADGNVYWRTQEGGLAGFGYRFPNSGEFRIRAVFLTDAGARRSEFIEDDDLTRFPEATPTP